MKTGDWGRLKPDEFKSWDSFRSFANSVRHGRRFVREAEADAFLATVLATSSGREIELKKGMILYRAQRGIEWRETFDEDGQLLGEEPSGYGSDRMKPRTNRATEGRINPSGIPVLYLATTEQTAISEVRPWIGASVSVAQFGLKRKLRTIDLSRGHGRHSWSEIKLSHLLGDEQPDAETKERAVWVDIDNAFSKPITLSDDLADYAPTQILAEMFRNAGFDAVAYRSQFGKNGYNIALFSLDDADPLNCAPYEVTSIEVVAKEAGNRWYKAKS